MNNPNKSTEFPFSLLHLVVVITLCGVGGALTLNHDSTGYWLLGIAAGLAAAWGS